MKGLERPRILALARPAAARGPLTVSSWRGESMDEYALVLGATMVIGLAALQALGVSLAGVIDRVINRLALLG